MKVGVVSLYENAAEIIFSEPDPDWESEFRSRQAKLGPKIGKNSDFIVKV
jgi:hypothetical protein